MKKLIKKLACVISVMALSIIPIHTVFAEQDTGSITLTLGQGQDLTSVEDVEISCSKVADLVNGEYILLDEFKDTNVDLNNIKTAEQLQQATKQLQDLVKNDYIQYSNKQGIVSFQDLGIGVYLIKALDTTNYDELAPTLISIPTYNDKLETMDYHIQIEPKHEAKKGNIIIKKANEELELLSGAEFTLYEDINKNKMLDEADKKVGLFEETKKGIYEFKDLKYAYYLVQETKSPAGYVTDENIYPIVIYGKNKDNVIIQNNDNGYFINEYKIGKVEVENGKNPPNENNGFTPKTSDNLPLIFWCNMIIIFGGAGVVLFVRASKNKKVE